MWAAWKSRDFSIIFMQTVSQPKCKQEFLAQNRPEISRLFLSLAKAHSFLYGTFASAELQKSFQAQRENKLTKQNYFDKKNVEKSKCLGCDFRFCLDFVPLGLVPHTTEVRSNIYSSLNHELYSTLAATIMLFFLYKMASELGFISNFFR